ncbi:MAG: Hpt domain-containing protein [Thermodesulfobacteriota bacterium]|nr:Hpt domain-containing protein [Thermodesulfobacteriota bacterium]
MNITKQANDQGLTYEEFLDIVHVFIDTSRHDLERMRDALAREDAEDAVQAAHSLKGAAGNLGFDDLYDTALEAEKCARASDLARMPQFVNRLDDQLKQLISSAGNAN